MDPVESLIDGAIQNQLLFNKNPYITMETIILRLYRKIASHTRVSYVPLHEKTIFFSDFHQEILTAYETIKSNMSQEEKAIVERVLSKDSPHPHELVKFATCWYKYDPKNVCKWFAVDGLLGIHPKFYVQDAFSNNFEKHNRAVRIIYDYLNDPEKVNRVIEKAIRLKLYNESCGSDLDPEFEKCVQMYWEMMDESEMIRVDKRSQNNNNINTYSKRKKNQESKIFNNSEP